MEEQAKCPKNLIVWLNTLAGRKVDQMKGVTYTVVDQPGNEEVVDIA